MTPSELPPDSQSAQPDRRPGPAPAPAPGGGFGPGTAPATRPGTVTAASVLWIVLGGLLSLGAVSFLSTPGGANVSLVAIVLVFALGMLFIALGSRLRRGVDTRVALTVLGALLSLALWPVLLVVPAIVLQFRADSKAWFDSGPPAARL